MPRIFGLKLSAVLAATVAFWMLGFVWYGIVFMDAWMAGHDLNPDDGGSFDIYMFGGILITLAQVIGLGIMLRWRAVSGVGGAVKTAAMMWAFIALPIIMYAYIYLPDHNSTLLMIDGSHVLSGWVISAIILTILK